MGGGSLNNKNNASSKKYAIVFGIIALVIVTTAASYAFYTYSRTGETTTAITSGDIEFTYKEGASAELANAFPVSDSVGAKDKTKEYTFEVNMKSTSNSNKMNYDVWLLDANNDENTNYFNNEQIKFALIKNGTYVAGTSENTGIQLSTIDGFTAREIHGEGLVLTNQEIANNVTDTYKLRIWISDDVNYSNEIDENGTMTGTYNSYKYSLKVKVTSGLGSSIEITEPEMTGRTIVTNLEDEKGLSAYAITESSTAPMSDAEWTEITEETAKSNIIRTAAGRITKKTIQHKVDNYGTYYIHVKNILGEVKSKKIDVVVKDIVKDTSGAATPVIKGNLVPVIMNGSDVIKADTSKGWYNYDESIWANAVILTDDAPTYNNGDMIKEEHIESYFVWIPRYEYKIFNEGNYTEVLTEKGDPTQEIEIKFVDKDKDAVKNGSTVGTWLTHPAFTSFDSNGMWVGKFESGYKGATTTEEAQKNEYDSSKLIIKPNVYSWRGIQAANAHQTSFNYNRDLDSHMMKNTEWGAVDYLSHSKYGNIGSVRINNNKNFVTGYSGIFEPTIGPNGGTSIEGNLVESIIPGNDGEYSINYLNNDSVKSSTTGNYSGIYDMSGGAWEHVMGVVADSEGKPLSGRHSALNSGFQGNYGCYNCTGDGVTVDTSQTGNTTGIPFPEDSRYYDLYPNTNKYNTRILGDATGELGPFYSENDLDGLLRVKSYWYGDMADYSKAVIPWIERGGSWANGSAAGIFAFYHGYGHADTYSFRVVLTPQENQ